MKLGRVLRHLFAEPFGVRRQFPERTLLAIETAIRACESRHDGEIRFAVEAALSTPALLRDETPRERAVAVFTQLRVWDTERNTGVLIYLLLADRDVEIVADRGIHSRVEQGEWEAVCRLMEAEFRAGRFEAGALAGIHAVSDILARHFPPLARNPDEQPNRPVIL